MRYEFVMLSADELVRFWSKVAKSDNGCWEWTASVGSHGYGQLSIRKDGVRTIGLAHRLSFEIHFGVSAGGAFICHHCDNRLCVRPDHLFLGDNAANMADMKAKGRHWTKQHPEWIDKLRVLRPGSGLRGESAPNANLTDAVVLAMRADYESAEYSTRQLAEKYGTSVSNTHRIITGKIWAHLPVPPRLTNEQLLRIRIKRRPRDITHWRHRAQNHVIL